ncbi:hypothetical protein PsaNZ64_00295 [Pseudomonas syringae pv. actinidiae]|uniref:hypothetical protein n=1 Tax=Pseudomonas syringae group TaxID=136849 RepID=UPI000940DF78|nr:MULTISPECIES: hypothetical protein [Pseudomonas syringae group]OKS78755.1 hypothetical protein PsaNZ64_00295 [Pseudomonas syringae pv. actinidiae]
MQSNFSLSDADVRRLVDDAQHSLNIDLLRSHIYRFVSLRKEMAVAIHNAAQERSDLVRIVETANKVLTEDRSTGLLSLLDRKGLISGHREKLRVQLQTNKQLAEQNADFRQRLSASQHSAAPTQALREQVTKLTTQLTNLTARHEQALQDLEQVQHEKAVSPSFEPVSAPAAGQSEDLLAKVAQQADEIERLQNELNGVRGALNERRQNELAVAVTTQAAETPELEKIQTMFRDQVSGYLAENLQLSQALRTNKEALETLTSSLRHVEGLLEAASQTNTESSLTIQDLRSQITTAEGLIHQLQEDLVARDNTIGQLQAEILKSQQELTLAQKNESQLKEQLSAAQGTIADQSGRIDALTLNQGNLSEQVVKLTQQNGESEQQVQSLQHCIQQHIDQIEGIQRQLDETVTNWQNQQSASTEQLAQRDELISGQRAEMAALEASKSALERTVIALTENTQNLVQVKQALEGALKANSTERRRITSLAKDTALDLCSALQANKALKSQVNDLQATVNELNSRLQTASKVIHFAGPASRREAPAEEVPTFVEESSIEHSGPGNSM